MSDPDLDIARSSEESVILQLIRMKFQQPCAYGDAIGATERRLGSYEVTSPLSTAVQMRYDSLARYLIAEGAGLVRGFPAHYAAAMGNISFFQCVAEFRGVDELLPTLVKHQDGGGSIALARAAEFGHLELLQWVFDEYGVTVLSALTERQCCDILRAAAQCGSIGLLNWLLSALSTHAGSTDVTRSVANGPCDFLLLSAAHGCSKEVLSFALSRVDRSKPSFPTLAGEIFGVLACHPPHLAKEASRRNIVQWFLSTLSPAVARDVCSSESLFAAAVRQGNAHVCSLLLAAGADAQVGIHALMSHLDAYANVYPVPPGCCADSAYRATLDALLARVPGACALARLPGNTAACKVLSRIVCAFVEREAAQVSSTMSGHQWITGPDGSPMPAPAPEQPKSAPLEALLHFFSRVATHGCLPLVELIAVLVEYHALAAVQPAVQPAVPAAQGFWACFSKNRPAAAAPVRSCPANVAALWHAALTALADRPAPLASAVPESQLTSTLSERRSRQTQDTALLQGLLPDPASAFALAPVMPVPAPLDDAVWPAGALGESGEDADGGPSCGVCCELGTACAQGCIAMNDPLDIALARIVVMLAPHVDAAFSAVDTVGAAMLAHVHARALGRRRPNVLWVLQQQFKVGAALIYRAISVRNRPDFANDAGGAVYSAWCARLSLCVRLLGLPQAEAKLGYPPPDFFCPAICEGNVPLVRLLLVLLAARGPGPELKPLDPREAAFGALDPTSRALPLGPEADEAMIRVVRVIGRFVRVSQPPGARNEATAVWDSATDSVLRLTLKRVMFAFKPVDESSADVAQQHQRLGQPDLGVHRRRRFYYTPPFGNGPMATVGALLQLGADPHSASFGDGTSVLHDLLAVYLPREARDFTTTFRTMLRNARGSPHFSPPSTSSQ